VEGRDGEAEVRGGLGAIQPAIRPRGLESVQQTLGKSVGERVDVVGGGGVSVHEQQSGRRQRPVVQGEPVVRNRRTRAQHALVSEVEMTLYSSGPEAQLERPAVIKRRATMGIRTYLALGSIMGLCAFGAGGCGSDADGDGGATSASTPAATTSTTANVDAGIERARKAAAELEAVGAGIEIPKLGKRPPSGLKVTIITCPLPACRQTTDGAVAAAKDLGWKVKYVTTKLTPEDYVARLEDVIKDPPDALGFLSAFPNASVKPQLDKIKALKIPLMQMSPQGGEAPGDGIPGMVVGPPQFKKSGEVAAVKVIADGGASTNAVLVHDPGFGVFKATIDSWDATFKADCPGCKTDKLEVSLSSPPAQTTAAVVTYLRRHPDVKYVFFVIGDAALGLPPALATAGLADKVKFITLTPSLTDLKQVQSGQQWATIQNENYSAGYRATDGLARQSIGEGVGPEEYPAGYHRILTKDNVDASKMPVTPGTPEKFREAWGLTP
jgi:ABC-type sugar transport system substrate-binding protein